MQTRRLGVPMWSCGQQRMILPMFTRHVAAYSNVCGIQDRVGRSPFLRQYSGERIAGRQLTHKGLHYQVSVSHSEILMCFPRLLTWQIAEPEGWMRRKRRWFCWWLPAAAFPLCFYWRGFGSTVSSWSLTVGSVARGTPGVRKRAFEIMAWCHETERTDG